jgi:hypothetical protein
MSEGAHAKLIKSIRDGLSEELKPKFDALIALLAKLSTTVDGIEARLATIESMKSAPQLAPQTKKAAVAPAPAAAAPAAAPAAAAPAAAAAAAPAAPAAAAADTPAAAKSLDIRRWFREAFAANMYGFRELYDSPELRREHAERDTLKKLEPDSVGYLQALGYQIWGSLSEAQKTQVKNMRAAGNDRAARAAETTQLEEE